MGTKMVEKITIEAVSNKPNAKYKQAGGLKTAEGWLNVAEGNDLSAVFKGDTLEVEIEVSKEGKRKISKILGVATKESVVATTSTTPSNARVEYSQTGKDMLITDLAIFKSVVEGYEENGLSRDERKRDIAEKFADAREVFTKRDNK